MTLLGANATFSMGTSVGSRDPSMGKSLDEMIQDRRKSQTKESKRGPKKASAVDRSIATGKAKRDAAMKQRRGLSETKQPTKMEVDRALDRQKQKSADERKKNEKKVTKGRIAPDSTGRNNRKKAMGKPQDPPAAIFGGRAPPKKAIEAAVKGMEAAGFKIPQGHQVVMTFVPTVITTAVPAKEAPKKPDGVAPKKSDGGKWKKGGPPAKKGGNDNNNNNSNGNNNNRGGKRN